MRKLQLRQGLREAEPGHCASCDSTALGKKLNLYKPLVEEEAKSNDLHGRRVNLANGKFGRQAAIKVIAEVVNCRSGREHTLRRHPHSLF